MAIEFKDVWIRVRSDFEDAAKGFSRARREIESVGEAAENASDQAKELSDQARRLTRTDFALKFRLDGAKEMLEDLQRIDKELQVLESRKVSVDPKAREEAQKTRHAIRQQIGAYEALIDEVQKAARIERREQEKIDKVTRSLSRLRVIERKKELSAIQQANRKAHQETLKQLNEQRRIREQTTTKFISTDFQSLLKQTQSEVGGLGGTLDRAATQADSWGSRMDRVGGILTRISPLVRGLSMLIGSSLAGAFAALAAGIAAGIGGLAAAAVSFAAALAPLLGLFTGFMSRLGAIMQAVKAHSAAQKAETEAAANAQKVQAQEADKVRSAVNATRDATEGLADANREAARAAEEFGDAEAEALREIEDAAERASDAVRDLAGAHLGVKQAQLNLQEAQLALKEFGREAGIGEDALNDFFQKFKDVDLRDTDKLKRLMVEAGGAAKGMGEGTKLEFQQRLLDVAQAKLGIEEANDRVGDSERDLQDAQAESARLQREGIRGTDAYREAKDRLVAANAAVVDAERRLADAHRGQKDALAEQKEALSASTEAMKAYEQQRKDLSAAEQLFLDDIIRLSKSLKQVVQTGTDPLFEAMHGLVPAFESFLPYMQALAGRIGTDAAANLRALAAQLTTLPNLLKAVELGDLSADLANTLGGPLARNLAQAFLNVAAGAAPILRGVLGQLVVWSEDFRRATEGFGRGSSGFELLRSGAMALLSVLQNVGRALFAFFAAAGPQGVELVKWISQAAAQFADWASSEGGRKRIQQFLAVAIPFAKALVSFLVRLATLAAEVFEFFGPGATDLIKGLTVIVNVLVAVVDFLNNLIPAGLRAFVTGILLPLAKVKTLGAILTKLPQTVQKVFGLAASKIRIPIGILLAALHGIGAAWDWVIDKIQTGWDWIQKAFEDAVNWIENFLGIGSPSKLFMDIGKAILEGLLAGVLFLPKLLFNAGKTLIRALVRGIRSAAQWIYRTGSWVVRRVIAGAKFLVNAVVGVGRWFVRQVIAGIKFLINALGDVGEWIINKVVGGIKGLVDAILAAGKWVVDKVAEGARSAKSKLEALGGWIAETINKGIKLGRDAWNWGKDVGRDLFGRAKAGGEQLGYAINEGTAQGLNKSRKVVYHEVKKVGQGIVGMFKGALKVRSPSRVMMSIGQMTMLGFAHGIAQGVRGVHDTITNAVGPGAMASLVGDIPATLARGLRGGVVELAAGGVVGKATTALIGEGSHKEAVLPLSRAVFDRLGRSIARSMAIPGQPALSSHYGGGAMAMGRSSNGYVIEKMDVILPPAPGYAQMGDPRHQAAQFARELRRRGGQGIGGGGVS